MAVTVFHFVSFFIACVAGGVDYLPQDYDKSLHPGFTQGNTTEVQVSLRIRSLGSVDQQTWTIKTDFYFRSYWTDVRLIG